MATARTISSLARTDRPVAPSGRKPAPDCTLVIFGAHGDLTKRLLTPALYDLKVAGLLSDGFRIVGVDMADDTLEGWIEGLTEMMEAFTKDAAGEFYTPSLNEEAWTWLKERLSYERLDFTNPDELKKLSAHIDSNAVFYLAIPSRFFAPAVDALGASGLTKEPEGGFRRIAIEKPFGTDLQSAQELNRRILDVVKEQQIFRIDHFLGKETVQNILAMRFGNVLFEPLWHRDYIDNVQITAAETVNVESRGSFYEGTGALRDMVPNHLFQMLAMVAMEPPASFAAEKVRTSKQTLFESILPVKPEDVVRGQYTKGEVKGKSVPSYRDADGVASDSVTETYVAMKLEIQNWRWAGVPFYLRTGKALSNRRTEIVVEFRRPPLTLFPSADTHAPPPNRIVLNVQPTQGVTLCFAAKKPGPEMRLSDVEARFRYPDFFNREPNVGYETLLYDCLCGDATLFQRADNIDVAWSSVEPVLESWRSEKTAPELYEAGTAGPAGADELLARDGREWSPIDQKS
ncbi:glucose-6-phosphate 1-dehydrogenase [Acetobacter nitrogenifigens DSM 23921 = NBRC 105050]|uniref:Glucose-6-phosphate 1-dehydrogenase n=1 Tax=Acetobacter nitrogenifigens DSM 23921 = NBRC 105050 TaxID=1120919 RepID=A0A511XCC7_9PROT|nr:glucose-6-phosphate dehydrogenase [Acetobacter nitrogenifigens]GBQ93938.1 glucose-6-phosphate 1-dehydrogenase [Acetobacter nitrogenifigens DSM 23921 = NBRC 105050]GEN60614.1 glucose-6-phosphate 1-dehydrogenase [Acetobacter nitrogenifigens DSM 23921 = NBRC 105050]